MSKYRILSLIAVALLASCSDVSEPEVSAQDVAQSQSPGLQLVRSYDAAGSTYQDLDGRGLEIDSFEGQKVFVNYWATWCAPCIRELPSLYRAAEAMSDDNTVFLFASDESLEKITFFLEERGFEGNFIKLNNYFGAQGIDAVPSSVLFDESGDLIGQWLGAYEWDSAEMLAELRNPPAVD